MCGWVKAFSLCLSVITKYRKSNQLHVEVLNVDIPSFNRAFQSLTELHFCLSIFESLVVQILFHTIDAFQASVILLHLATIAASMVKP
jgi:hypothetical protein